MLAVAQAAMQREDATLTVTGIVGSVTPAYPVAAYSHKDGDAISSGVVYRGSLMPQMNGKYFFGDITTARLFYCDLGDMIATAARAATIINFLIVSSAFLFEL